MKNQSLTIAKLRKLLLVTALVICPLLLANTGFAQNMATATLLSGGMNSISITQTGTFQLSLAVTTNFVSVGYSVFYQVSPNGLGLFQAVSRINNSPTNPLNMQPYFNDPTTDDFTAFFGTAGVLNPSSQFDLGYTTPGNPVLYAPAGMYALQTITFNTLNAAPGTYTIFLDSRSVMGNSSFGTEPMGGAMGPQFIVTVIPEPATVGLAVVGGAVLLLLAWRKRARA